MADCSPINPLSSLATTITTFAAPLHDLPSFKPAASSSSSPSQLLLINNQPHSHHHPPNAHAFLHANSASPAASLASSLPFSAAFATAQLHQQQPHQSSPAPDALVDQFMRLDLHKQQQHHHHMHLMHQQHHMQQQHINEMERAYQSQAMPAHQQWANEYSASTASSSTAPTLVDAHHHAMHAMHHQPFAPQHHQQQMHVDPRAMFMQRAPMPMSLMHSSPHSALYSPQLYHPASHHMPASRQAPSAHIVELKEDDSKSANATTSSSSTTTSPFVDQFVNAPSASTATSSSSSGGMGGLDDAMLSKLMNSDDPKWRNSKFLQFISKIRNGQIEFTDNQAIERPAPATSQQTNHHTQQQQQQQQSEVQGNEWADELDEQSQREAAAEWGKDFDQREGLRPLNAREAVEAMANGWNASVGQDESTDEAVWRDEYESLNSDEKNEQEWARALQSHPDLDDFSHINWREALDRAKNGDSSAHTTKQDPAYNFTSASSNPYLTGAATGPSAFEVGKALLEQGDLPAAILALEAAVQAEPDNSDAWCYLGSAAAENEQEAQAIAALLKSVSIDPYNLRALLLLGVEYTNDLEDHRALGYLKTWLENNPDYQHASVLQSAHALNEYQQFYSTERTHGADNAQAGNALDVSLHDQVTAMFRSAVSLHPDDAELHTVMGVLYHISSDFDLAIQSFKTALKYRPNDAQLWNKLGATQANSTRSTDAVHAYRRALTIRPNYTRALANLAISYANQGQHQQAAQHYLKTLKANPNASHVWSYLRISLSHLGNQHLVELTHQNNVQLFAPYFTF